MLHAVWRGASYLCLGFVRTSCVDKFSSTLFFIYTRTWNFPDKNKSMKLKNIFLAALTFLFVLFSMNTQGQEKDYSLAKVGKKIYGVYIFIGSEPYYAYDYIATIDVKINWTGSKEENFEKAISKAKKKYPNFNGMIFQSSDFSKVDLIRFKDLEITRGGVSVGSKVSFIDKNQVYYGEVIELESSNDKGSVKYLNVFDEEEIKELSYSDLTPLSEEDYFDNVEEFKKEIEKYKFNIGEKVKWIDKDLLGRNDQQKEGAIIKLDNKAHKASVKCIEEDEDKIVNISYLDLIKVEE